MALIAPRRDRIISSAERLVARGRLQAAIKEYRKVLRHTSEDTNTLNRVGDLYARLNQIDEAVDLFRQIAGHYERDGFFVKAIAIYKKILRLDPSQSEIHSNLGDLYRRQGLVIEARAQYQNLADERRQRRDLEGSREMHRKLLELEPRSLGNMAVLVELLEENGRSDEARNGYRFMAERLLSHGESDGAEGVYLAALQAGVGDEDFVVEAVTHLRRNRQPEIAERLLSEALKKQPQARDLLALVGAAPEPDIEVRVDSGTGVEAVEPEAAKTAGETRSEPSAVDVPPVAETRDADRQPSEEFDFELDLDQLEASTAGPPVESEEGVDDLLAEVAVFIKYGLDDKAVECLHGILDSHPRQVEALRQLIRLRLGQGEHQAVVPLALRLAAEAGEGPGAAVWNELSRDLESAGFRLSGDRIEAPIEAAASGESVGDADRDGRADPTVPRETESIEENVAWLEELAQETRAVEPAQMFGGEDEFFDLAAELEEELDPEVELSLEAAGEPATGPSLDRIVETFRQKIGESLSESDFDTHFNLGIAYREMGLLDEAITEFQLAAKDSRYLVDCCSLLGASFLEKGFPDLAVKWYRRGLEAPSTDPSESLGLLYELASLYQSIGDVPGAHESYGRICDVSPDYRDVAARLRDLEPQLES